MFNDSMIEIRSGVNPGDEVLLSPIVLGDAIDMEGSFASTEDITGPDAVKIPSAEELKAAQQVGRADMEMDEEAKRRADKANQKVDKKKNAEARANKPKVKKDKKNT